MLKWHCVKDFPLFHKNMPKKSVLNKFVDAYQSDGVHFYFVHN